MNSQLRSMIVQAEGRHLDEDELGKIRAWATGLEDRIATARRLEAAEDEIVSGAARRLSGGKSNGQASAATARSFDREHRLFLHYAALACIKDDPSWFQSHFAEWTAELLIHAAESRDVIASLEALREALEERLDPLDQRRILPLLNLFLTEVKR